MELIFEWDARKAKLNLKNHKVSFEEAKSLFNDPYLNTYPDELHSQSEERLISIGYSDKNRLLLLVHTVHAWREKTLVIRIISCRKATPLERKTYEEEN